MADAVLVRTVADADIVELNGSGVLIWLALVEPATAGELATELAALVGAQVEVVAGDIRAALADLVRRGFVVEMA